MLTQSEIENSMSLDGMTTRPALCLLGAFAEFAKSLNPSAGGLIEFGTYRGRVSALLGQLQRKDDQLHLVDIANYLNHERLKQLGIEYQFHQSASEKWDPSTVGDTKFWFSHHDASHYFSNVSHELTVMLEKLTPAGVVTLDDFTDPYSQVRAAYYFLRYARQSEFELLLQGWGKAILVRSAVFSQYEDFVLSTLQPTLAELGCPTTLFRTDVAPEARAFSIALKKAPSDPDRYGLSIWGDRFYRSSKT